MMEEQGTRHLSSIIIDSRAGRYTIDLIDLCFLLSKNVKVKLAETVRTDGAGMSQENDQRKKNLGARVLIEVAERAGNSVIMRKRLYCK